MDIVFVIEDSLGNTRNLGVKVRVLSPDDEDFSVLDSSQARDVMYDLQSYYHLTEADTYTVYAIYINRSDAPDGRIPWKGTVTSNPVTFTVEP